MIGFEIDTDGSVASDITIALLRLSLHCLVYTPTGPRFPLDYMSMLVYWLAIRATTRMDRGSNLDQVI